MKDFGLIRKSIALLLAGTLLGSVAGCQENVITPTSTASKVKSTAASSKDDKKEILAAPPELKKKYFLGISPSGSVNIPEDEWANYKELGVKSLRVHIQLGNLNHNPAFPDFKKYDAVVKRAKADDIEVVLLLSYESYKSVSEEMNKGWGPILNFQKDCKNMIPMVQKTIEHFKDSGVKKYEIWNEENGMWNIDPESYAGMITEIYEKCKYTDKWDPTAIIAFGGLDGVNVNWDDTGINYGSRQYVRDFYETNAYKAFKAKYKRSPFDAFALHPYNTFCLDGNLKVDYNKIASAVQMTVVDVMKEYGDEKIPIWITEFGNQDADENLNAATVYEAIKEIYKIPQVETLHWFKYCYGGGNESNYSIVLANGTKRKSYYSFRQAALDIAKGEQ